MGFSSLFAPDIEKLAAARNVQGLVKALAHRNEGVRRRAAFALANLSFETQAQIMGARALGQFDDAEATGCLLQMLNCMGAEVREVAALVLAQKKGTPAVVPVIEALREKDQDVRFNAAKGLGKIGDQRAVQPLIELLESQAVEIEVRLAALLSLAELGDARALPQILRFIETVLPDVFPKLPEGVFFVKDVAKHLGRIGKEAIPALVQLLPFAGGFYSPKEEVKAACQQVGPDSIGPLVAALHSRSEIIRSDAADILDTLRWKPDTSHMMPYLIAKHDFERVIAKGDAAIGPLIDCLHDRGLFTRVRAAEALGKMKAAAVIDVMLEWLGTDEVCTAIKVLLGMRELAVEPLIGVLRQADKAFLARSKAIDVLEQIGDARAIQPLISLLNDESLGFSAEFALEKITGEHLHGKDAWLAWSTSQKAGGRSRDSDGL